MPIQATRCTQRQLAYWGYWTKRGYTFGRDDLIPESTSIKPDDWNLPTRTALVVTAAMLVIVYGVLWVSA